MYNSKISKVKKNYNNYRIILQKKIPTEGKG